MAFDALATGIGPVLAHEGGWDEALLVLVPIVLFAAILILANRRAKAIQQRRRSAEPAHDAADAHPSTDDATER